MKKIIFVKILLPCLLFWSCDKASVPKLEEAVPETSPITFNGSIRPLFTQKCGPCHIVGGERVNKYNDFNTVVTLLTGVQGRIKRDISDPLVMPKGGPKLSNKEMLLFDAWVKDGLLEKK